MSITRACLFGTACLLALLAQPLRAEPSRADDYGDPLPPGAVARLGTVRLRHSLTYGSGGACVAFSPDGKTLVSGGDVGLCAWDVATGKDLGWFPGGAPGTAARFAPDGQTLLTTDNRGSIRLWQAGTGRLLRETKPLRNNQPFHALDSFVSADSRVVGANGQQDGVFLWEAETGKQILALKDEVRGMFSAALSPDGKTLVVSGARNRARLVEVATGKEVRQFEGPDKAPAPASEFDRMQEEWLFWFTFSPDGKSLAGASGKDSFCVWNVADGRLRFTVRGCRGRLAFSPDSKHLVCGGKEATPMRLYETATGREVRQFDAHPGFVYALAFSPDGKTVASGENHTVDLWDVDTGKRRHSFAGHASPVVSVAFSPDGSGLASGDSQEGTLIVWDLKARKPRHTFASHLMYVLSLAYSPDGKTLAAGDGAPNTPVYDAQIQLWDLSAGRLLRQFPGHLAGVGSLSFSPDGKRLASGGHDARVRVWDAATGQRLLQIRGESSRSKSAAFSPDGRALLVAGSDGGVGGELALWRPDSGQKVRDLGTTGAVPYAAFLPDGRTVLARQSGRISVWDAQDGRLLRSFSLGDAYSPGAVNGYPVPLALSPDGHTLAVSGDHRDPAIQLWDTATGKRVGRLSGHKGGPAQALAFSPDGKTLASGGPDTTVLLWDAARARLEHLWAELAGGPGEGSQAGKRLAATPGEAIPFLKDRLRRAAAAEDRARRPLADLDSDDFEVREKASRELEGLGPEAALPLLVALQGSPSAEARARIEKVLNKLKAPQGEQGFQPRGVSLALAVLEEIGTPEARQALDELSKGPAKSMVTREAGAALERLAKRRKP
jgi:WD40 repeat protein